MQGLRHIIASKRQKCKPFGPSRCEWSDLPPPPKDILVFSPSLHFFLLNLLLQSEQLVVYVSLFPSDRDVVSRAACYLDSLVLGLAVV